MNNITISGYVGADLEKRVFVSGNGVSLFNVAVRRLIPNKNNEYDTQWFECRILGFDNGFSRYAEKICKKGCFVIASGELCVNRYKDKNGFWNCSPYIIVNKLEKVSTDKQRNAVIVDGWDDGIVVEV